MKRPYDAMKPLGRLLGVFALLLSTSTICLCCSSDPATPDAPAAEGGGNLDPDEPDKLPDVAAYKVPDVVEMGFADTFLPVSYTHLDVYKRQAEACAGRSDPNGSSRRLRVWRACRGKL